jgi:hypothetical protein
MKSFVFSNLLWILMGFVPQAEITHRLVVLPLSTLTINRKTNVNKYHCAIASYSGTDTLLLRAERGKGAFFTKGLVRLEASGFDCGMKVMTADFVKTIEADKYPFITIDFISFERVPKYEKTAEEFKGKLKISLANLTVPFEVRCNILKDENGYIHLTGSHYFTFSDFGLEPPSRVMGAVKVHENLAVNFHLVLIQK